MDQILLRVLFVLPAFIVGLTIHECAHALAAYRLGDPTAKHEGRLSLNPLVHIDPWGLLLIIFIGFGWAKPVPFNPRNFKNPVRDSVLVALAGPTSNILLALLLALPIKYLYSINQDEGLLYGVLYFLFQSNLVLAVFNMFPFPPLDGSKVLAIFIPKKYYPAYYAYLDEGMMYFMLFLLFDNFFLTEIFHFSIIGKTIWTLVEALSSIILLSS